MRTTRWHVALMAAAFSLAGCSDIAPPNWLHPGPFNYQRAQAERTDPFPETDVGPEIVGGRPKDFQKPSAEPTRVQTEYSWAKRYGQPPAGLFRSSSVAPRNPGARYVSAPAYSPSGSPTAPYYGAPGYPSYAGATQPYGNPAPVATNWPAIPAPGTVPPGSAPPSLLPQATVPTVGLAPSIQQGAGGASGQAVRSTGPDMLR